MRQSMQPIEESFDRLKQFTADASHELRSPLMAISSNAKVALKYADGMRDGDREKFESIQSASSQMATLTKDLLFSGTHRKNSLAIRKSPWISKNFCLIYSSSTIPKPKIRQIELFLECSGKPQYLR